MIITESEAREKRCCGPEGCGEARVIRVREGESALATKIHRFCIASECAAWQVLRHNNSVPMHDQAGNERGYCGLAR